MARTIHTRYRLTGTLIAVNPLHVGSGTSTVNSDLAVARDGQGRLYVPGTSLAGLVRDYLRLYYSSNGSNQTEGEAPSEFQRIVGYQESDLGWASQLIVDDAVIENVGLTEVRDHVGTDRQTGTAAERIKFDREVIPAGSRIPLNITLDCENKKDAVSMRHAMASLVAALRGKHLRLGGAKSRGLGRLQLRDSRLSTSELATRQGILRYLREKYDGTEAAGTENFVGDASSIVLPARLDVMVYWRATSALMVKAAVDGEGADFLPLMSQYQAGLLPVIPGSSLKGTLRTEAERILRTVVNPCPINNEDSKKRFLEQLNDPALDLVHWLFGQMARGAGNEEGQDQGRPLRGYSAIRIDDCFPRTGQGGLRPLPVDVWRQIREASVDPESLVSRDSSPPNNRTTQLGRLLDQHGLPRWTTAFHVAIDRWTGGASDGMFFKVLEPRGVPWEPIHCELDLKRIPDQLHLPAVALLLLVLQRLADGATPIGFGGNRGMGEIAIDGVEFLGKGLPTELSYLQKRRFTPFSLDGLDVEFRESLQHAWRQYCDQAANAQATGQKEEATS